MLKDFRSVLRRLCRLTLRFPLFCRFASVRMIWQISDRLYFPRISLFFLKIPDRFSSLNSSLSPVLFLPAAA